MDRLQPVPDPAIPFEFRGVLDALADPVVAASADHTIVYANRAVEDLLGWPPGELTGRPLVTIVPPRFRPAHVAAFTRFTETGERRVMGHPLRVPALARSGDEVDIDLALSAYTLPDGEPLVVASLRERTDRLELERQIEITHYLRATTRAAAEFMSLLDPERLAQAAVQHLAGDFDAALARLWIYDPADDTLRLSGSAGLSEETARSSRAVIDVTTYPYKVARVARERRPFVQNGLLGDEQFDQAWVEAEGLASVAVFPLLHGSSLLGVLAYFSRRALSEDVAEILTTYASLVTAAMHDVRILQEEQRVRLGAEAAERRSTFLAESGQVLASSLDYDATLAAVARLAVSALADLCFVDIREEDGSVRRVSIAHTDAAREELLADYGQRSAADQDARGVIRAIQTGEPILVPEITPAQIETSAHDEERLHILRILQPYSYMCVPLVARGEVIGTISFLTDRLSGRRYGEEDLQLAEQLAARAALAVDSARLYRDLREAVQLRDEFLSSVSHDLKNPLTTLKVRIQMLARLARRLEGESARRLVEGLAQVDGTAERMARLIDDLVDVAHLRIGRPLALDRQAMDLVELVRDVVAEQQATYRRPIGVEAGADTLPLRADAVRLERVLTNLLSNAVRYSAHGSPIDVCLTRDEDTAVIAVSDRGIGIPEQDLPHIFDRFYRASNTGEIEGTGIGLAGTAQIVAQHGGTISAASREGEGTVFTVRLPIAD